MPTPNPTRKLFFEELERGTKRAAIKENGLWRANEEVKAAILEAFKEGELVSYNGFFDKNTILPRELTLENNVRLVPGGSTIRSGAFVAPGVVIMPPSYINIGAYIDEGCLIDSHVLIGSCAQVGKRVHISAGVQLGGVLEPVGQTPIVIEDDAFIGAGAVIVEGVVVKKRAVIAPGVVLSKGVQIYDAVNKVILDKGAPIPEGAVVVQGTRPITKNAWAEEHQLHISCPVIVKYRDDKTDRALCFEEALR